MIGVADVQGCINVSFSSGSEEDGDEGLRVAVLLCDFVQSSEINAEAKSTVDRVCICLVTDMTLCPCYLRILINYAPLN